MKIVFLSDDFPPYSFGGAGISTSELALGMKKTGHDVSVITTCREQSEAGKSDYKGLSVWKVASNYNTKWRSYVSLYNAPVIRKLKKLLKDIKPDVVHANNVHLYLSYHSLKVAKRYAKVVVWTARDTMAFSYGKIATKKYLDHLDSYLTWRDHADQAKKRWNPLRNFFIRKYLRYPDRLFAVSNALKDALFQNGISPVEVVHTGADRDAWRASEDEIIRFKKIHKVENKKIILFGGRLSEAKGGQKTLEALAIIVKDVPDAVLLVAGSKDQYAETMLEQAKKIGIEKHLVFTGWIERDHIKYAYGASHIVVVPSIYLDAFPRIVLEAMVSGKPVVGTCYGGASEIIKNGVTGYVVNPLKVEEMAERMIDLLQDGDKRERFGRAAYQSVQKDFNLKDKITHLVSCYQDYLK